MDNVPVVAAQYLRMSTEHQQYSLDNQEAAIRAYASEHGFSVVTTYRDSAKSGVVLKYRSGLRELLKDVMTGCCQFKTILVYDVSRWGRFQDNDEAAHYEFMCKSAGVPIVYCAEPFQNNGSAPDALMKALKRSMAGEYSRDLGVRILAGTRRLASLGFKQGGAPGYGFRRMLISPAGVLKEPLKTGERKNILTDRVRMVLGPLEEVELVREIYRMVLLDGRTVNWITRELNRRNIPSVSGATWNHTGVLSILTHPKYIGWQVYGCTSQRLYTPVVHERLADWVVTPNAHEGIVDVSTFRDVQMILRTRTLQKSNEQLLKELRSIFSQHGRVTIPLIAAAGGVSAKTYQKHFGSLERAYQLIGFHDTGLSRMLAIRTHTNGLREGLIRQLQSLFPNDLSVLPRFGSRRTRLRLNTGRHVSVLLAKVRRWKKTLTWTVLPVPPECRFLTLLVRLDERRSVHDLYLVSRVSRTRPFSLKLCDKWLDSGEPVKNLADFCDAVSRLRKRFPSRAK